MQQGVIYLGLLHCLCFLRHFRQEALWIADENDRVRRLEAARSKSHVLILRCREKGFQRYPPAISLMEGESPV